MAFGEFDQSFDFTYEIAPADWQGAAPVISFPLLATTPSVAETQLEQFGHDALDVVGGNYPLWGLYANGQAVGEYGTIPKAVQLGSVAVPIVTSRTRFKGPLEIRLFGGTTKPTSSVKVRVKGSQSQILTFRAERLERFRPKPTPAERLRQALRSLIGVSG